jgi:predicted DNA-binding transcriptional regulator AlpA
MWLHRKTHVGFTQYDPTFPQPVRTPGSRAVFFRSTEVKAYVDSLTAEVKR